MKVSAVIGTLFVFQCQALTYFLDSSCDGKLTFGEDEVSVVDEVKDMATKGSSKLKDESDEVMASAFKTIFKTEFSDKTTVEHVTKAFDVIGGMTAVEREASDVRIYCDNDEYGEDENGKDETEQVGTTPKKRWQLVADLPGAGKKSRNSKKPFEKQHYWDYINKIYRRAGSKGVQDLDEDGDFLTLAQTYKFKDNPDPYIQTENPDRESITIGNQAFASNSILRFSQIKDKKKDLKDQDIEYLDDLLSVTLFHELCHLTKVINAPGLPDPVGWESIMELDAEGAKINPDNYAFLGISAMINDLFQVRLSEKEDEAIKGILVDIGSTSGRQKGRDPA